MTNYEYLQMDAVGRYMGHYVLFLPLMKHIYDCIPNNWLKMHGYPKRRRLKNRSK